MKFGMLLMGLLGGLVAGCGTQPASLLVGNIGGALDVGIDGQVNPDINVNVDASLQADVNCTIVCDLNTGDCETVCELADGVPPTPEALGEALYLANCSACHGNPPGTGFAPNLAGESADDILAEFDDPDHPGGAFPNLVQEDIDNLAAFFASL